MEKKISYGKVLASVFVFLSLVLGMVGFGVNAEAADLNVPTPQYPSIQSAINAAQVGDTVFVAAGTYNENISMKSGINVVGNSPADTIIVGQEMDPNIDPNVPWNWGTVMFNQVPCAVLKGFTITADPLSNRIRSVEFRGSTTSSAVLQNCIIYGVQYGIFVWAPATPAIVNNTIVGKGTGEQGIYIGNYETSPQIINNIITGWVRGIYIIDETSLYTNEPNLEYNDVWGNTTANYMFASGSPLTDTPFTPVPTTYTNRGNISADPLFASPATNDYHLSVGPTASPCLNTGFPNGEFQNPYITTPGDGGFDMGAFGGGGNTFLDVSKFGTGSGAVTSSGGTWLLYYPLTGTPGIPNYQLNCPSSCTRYVPVPSICAPCASYYTAGSEITLTASADQGSQFVGWYGCGCSGTLSTCTRRYYAGYEQVQASFANIPTYTVTPLVAPGFTTPTGPQTVNHGETVSFTVTPYSAAWYINSVIGCGGSLSGNIYTTGPITGDCPVTATFSPCTYSVSPSSFTFGDSGGNGSFTVTTDQPTCRWGMSPLPIWIGLYSDIGWGTEAVDFAVRPNISSTPRNETIDIFPFASETPAASVTVNQAGCTYAINPYKAVLPASGGTFTVSVISSNGDCEWMAEGLESNNPDWLPIISPGAGPDPDSGIVTYFAEANNTGAKRTGTITIAGLTFTVEQQNNSLQENLVVPPSGTWVTATITNNTAETLITAKPTCCNTYFWLTDLSGNMVPPIDRICEPVGIPDSLVSIAPGGSFEIRCDLSEVAYLPQGTVNVMATYVNPLTFDPHYNGAGGCTAEGINDIGRTECFNLKPVVIPSGVAQMSIGAGATAQKTLAELAFNPQQWDPQWAFVNGPAISAQITGSASTFAGLVAQTSSTPAITCSNVDLSSIRMNGQAGISGSCMNTPGGITVKFDRSSAVLSLGTLVPGTTATVTIQGGFTSGTDIFYGQGSVGIVQDTGTLAIQADIHTVGQGTKPGSVKAPLSGMETRVFDKKDNCVAGFSMSWQNYPSIWTQCTAVATITTNVQGQAIFALPGGDYIVIGTYKNIYPGVNVGAVGAGSIVNKYLQVIQTSAGQILPAKYQKFTGSELLVIEPEYVEWSGTQELYPFIFESLGDWAVTTSVAPPEGFVADQSSLTVNVNTTLKAVQFTVTDIGSKWVPTKVKHKIRHNGKTTYFYSKVGLKLSARLQKKLGLGEFGEKE